MRIQILDWQLDTQTRELRNQAGRVHLRPLAFEVLLHLMRRAPAVVSKRELIDEVWKSRVVSDSAIAQVIGELRSKLDDDPALPRVIATRHRQGYQLIAELRELEEEDSLSTEAINSQGQDHSPSGLPVESSPVTPVGRSSGSRKRWNLVLGGIVVLTLLGLTGWHGGSQRPGKPAPPTSNGWPNSALAQPHLARGLAAARSLDSRTALQELRAALTFAETPRLSIQVARLLVQRGQPREAVEILLQLQVDRENLVRRDQLFADAVDAELRGNDHKAARLLAALAETHPKDLDFALAWWERDREADWQALERFSAQKGFPEHRRLLMAAQHAGRSRRTEVQLEKARTAISAAQGSAPVVAAFALFEQGRAFRNLGRTEEAAATLLTAAGDLQQAGELRAASRSLGLALRCVATRGKTQRLADQLAALKNSFQASNDPWEAARLAYFQGQLKTLEGNYTAAVEALGVSADLARDLESWTLAAAALMAQGSVLQSLGELDRAHPVLQEALRFAEATERPSIIAAACVNFANYFGRRGDLRNAVEYQTRALVASRRGGLEMGEATALVNLARLARQQGQNQRALELNEAARILFRELGMAKEEAVATFQMAEARLTLGQLATARDLAHQALLELGPLPAANFEAACLSLLSQIALRSGDLEGARDFLTSDSVPETQSLQARTRVQLERARLARELGDAADARLILSNAIDSIPDQNDTKYALPLRLLLARLEIEAGRPVVPEQIAREIFGSAERGSNPGLARDAALLIAESLLAQGNLRAAQDRLDEASHLLEAAPDFRVRLALALVQARLERAEAFRNRDDLAVNEKHRAATNIEERLSWVISTAKAQDHWLLALEAQVELITHSSSDLRTTRALAADTLAKELEERHLGRLRQYLRNGLSRQPG
ncbi:MAG: winged helix-turn-helix domain-containing protein [Deltaproteobacteria bacterium]|nr:winged helix-turn-helix domain-containing protein [Deltaproteobacteria bacterium]